MVITTWRFLTKEYGRHQVAFLNKSLAAQARKERQLHMQMYPGWSARDNYAQTKESANIPYGKNIIRQIYHTAKTSNGKYTIR